MPVPLIQTKKMPDATGVANNGTATMVIPATGTMYESRFRCLTSAGGEIAVATIKTDITNVTLRVDGDLVLDATPTFLFDRELFYNPDLSANVAGVLPYDFAKRNVMLPGERAQLALGTKAVDQIVAEFRLATTLTATTGLSGGKIEHYSDQTVEQRPAGPHMRINKFPQNFSTTGYQEIVTLPKEPGTGYCALHIEIPGSSVISDITFTVDGNDILQAVPAKVNENRLKRYKRAPQTGYYHIDFQLLDELLGFLPMDRKDGRTVQDLRLKINWATAAPNNYNIYAERVFDLTAPVV